jgi:pilus assembly protein CpaE
MRPTTALTRRERTEEIAVSAIMPNETALNWKANKREQAVQLYLSGAEGDAAELAAARVAGFPVYLNILPTTDWINPEELGGAVAAVIQVDADTAASIKRFQKLASTVETPLVAACYDPPLALVRSLIRSGAHDVIPLPLSFEDVESSLAPLAQQLSERSEAAIATNAKLVSFIKSEGGVGATSLMSQLAIRFAQREKSRGREACLIDLDVQFGDVAFQLGLQPRLTLVDLLNAGTRLDGDLLRATTIEHASGLKVLAAPRDMMPLEAVHSDHVLRIVDLATREFGTAFVDLPANWTNWSLSLVARSDLAVLVTQLTVAGLNRARRQLKLLESQDLDALDVRIVVNRYEKSLARRISLADAGKALGHEVNYTVANDFALMRGAIDQGIPIDGIKRRTMVAKDLDLLDAGIAAALRLER